MTDIVEWLRDRNLQNSMELRSQAADEIERLREHMRALADTSVDRDTAGIFKGLWQGSEQECEQLKAEIERLRKDKMAWQDVAASYHTEIEGLRTREARIVELVERNRELRERVEQLQREHDALFLQGEFKA